MSFSSSSSSSSSILPSSSSLSSSSHSEKEILKSAHIFIEAPKNVSIKIKWPSLPENVNHELSDETINKYIKSREQFYLNLSEVIKKFFHEIDQSGAVLESFKKLLENHIQAMRNIESGSVFDTNMYDFNLTQNLRNWIQLKKTTPLQFDDFYPMLYKYLSHNFQSVTKKPRLQ